MTATEANEGLSAELLSRMSKQRAARVIEELEALAATYPKDCEVTPFGPWISEHRDTLCAFWDDTLVGAVVVERAPMLDPMLLARDWAWPSVALNFLRLRAEGILQANGCDHYNFAVLESQMALWRRCFPDQMRSQKELTSDRLRFFRRSL